MIGYDDFILPCFGSKLIRVCDWVPTVQTIPFLATSMELGHVPFRIEYSFTYRVSIWVELLSRNLCKRILSLLVNPFQISPIFVMRTGGLTSGIFCNFSL